MTEINSGQANHEHYGTSFIDGTYSKNDYMVLCRTPDGSCDIGLKPLIAWEFKDIHVSFRLRCVISENYKGPDILPTARMDHMKEQTPGMWWSSASNTRLSLVVVAITPYDINALEKVPEYLNGAFVEALKKITQGMQWVIDPTCVVNYMMDSAMTVLHPEFNQPEYLKSWEKSPASKHADNVTHMKLPDVKKSEGFGSAHAESSQDDAIPATIENALGDAIAAKNMQAASEKLDAEIKEDISKMSSEELQHAIGKDLDTLAEIAAADTEDPNKDTSNTDYATMYKNVLEQAELKGGMSEQIAHDEKPEGT